MFLIQPDYIYKSRAWKPYTFKNVPTFKKLNHAIVALKKNKQPARLSYIDPDTKKQITVLFYEGPKPCFSTAKKKGLSQIGPRMYVVKSLVTKTTIKRKKKCAKSSLIAEIVNSAKSIQQDSN